MRKISFLAIAVITLFVSLLLVELGATAEYLSTSLFEGKKPAATLTREEFKGALNALSKKSQGTVGTSTSTRNAAEILTKKEALLLVCKEANWPVGAKKTYSKCLRYARKQKIIKGAFLAKKKITVREATRLLSQTFSKQVAPISPPEPPEEANIIPELPKEPEVKVEPFTPVNFRLIEPAFFSNITLNASFPNVFYHNEVYFFEGRITNGTYDKAFVFLSEKSDGQNSTNFLGEVKNGTFEIPVFFKEPGQYQLGIIPGTAGQSRIVDLSVLPLDLSIKEGTSSALTLHTPSYTQGKTTFSWDAPEANLTKLTLFQEQSIVSYFFRQAKKSFAPPYKDFESFKEGSAFWFLERGNAGEPFTRSATQTFKAASHRFRTIEKASIETISLQETFASPGEFRFEGKALIPLSRRTAFILPNGMVREVSIGDSKESLPSGELFKVPYSFGDTGRYIFEVNDPAGEAVLNVPIYVGGGVPLIPDIFDRDPPKLDKNPLLDLEGARKELLSLINRERIKHGVPEISLDSLLNTLAQRHSDDMVARNFFAHRNPDGEMPNDRRKKLGVPMAVQENLAKSATIVLAHEGLMESPIHRKAIIDPEVKIVGFGITKDSEGYFIITEEFSLPALTAQDLDQIEDTVLQEVNAKRSQAGIGLLTHNQTLRALSDEWSVTMVQESFLGFQSPSGSKLFDRVRARNIQTQVQGYVLEGSSKEILREEILEQEENNNAAFTEAGLGIAITKDGIFRATLLLTP